MIDLHNHLLGEEGLAGNLREALALCERAWREGVEEIVVTVRVPAEVEAERALIPAFERNWKELCARAPAGLRLGRGYEWALETGLAARLRRCVGVPTINGGAYLLVSFPSLRLPSGSEQALGELQAEGWRPILAHPECSRAVRRAPEVIARAIELGALVQIDALSLLGGYGAEAESYARRLVEGGRAHFIATRAGQRARREASLRAARARASRIIGRQAARYLVAENPRAVLANVTLAATRPPGRRVPILQAALNYWG